MDPEPEGNPINNECYAGSIDDNHLRTPDDPSPIILLRAKFIQNTPMDKDLVALVDSGSSHTMINRSALPYGTQTARGPAKRTTTTNGVMSSNETATIQRIKCPEFNRIIHDLTGDVFDSPTC